VTQSCRDERLLLGAYVLGALEADEAEEVRGHLARCAACAAEYARLAPLPGLLTLAAGAERAVAEPLAPALEERLLDAVAAERPRRPRRRRHPLRALGRHRGALAAGLVAASLAVVAVAMASRPAASEYGPEIPMRAAAAPYGAAAYAELRAIPGGTRVRLDVSGLPGNPAAVYEVHCDAPDWSASAGTFRVDDRGRATVILTTAARKGEYDHIRVVRRTGGIPQVVFDAALS
jgi:anti-sigma factor RsiW